MDEDKAKNWKYLFGPVPSRRLGCSLGVDLLPAKTCTYNCIYCQLGHTQNHSHQRREWVPTTEVKEELRQWIDRKEAADVVTFAGSGEPTLHSALGELLLFLRENRGDGAWKTCVLSNGSLIHLEEVRQDLAQADIVKLTCSAPDEESWKRIHQPVEGLSFEAMVAGMMRFREAFQGELLLEVMVLPGFNTHLGQMEKLATLCQRFQPDQIHLNTVVRPPVELFARPGEPAYMEEMQHLFGPSASIVGQYPKGFVPTGGVTPEAVLALLRRHPCSLADMENIFQAESAQIVECLKQLEAEGRIQPQDLNGMRYYRAAEAQQN